MPQNVYKYNHMFIFLINIFSTFFDKIRKYKKIPDFCKRPAIPTALLSGTASAAIWHKMAVSLCTTESADDKNRLEQDIAYIVDFLNSAVAAEELRNDIPVNDIAMDIVFSMYGASLGRCMAHQDIDLNDWAGRFLKQILPLHLDPYRI